MSRAGSFFLGGRRCVVVRSGYIRDGGGSASATASEKPRHQWNERDLQDMQGGYAANKGDRQRRWKRCSGTRQSLHPSRPYPLLKALRCCKYTKCNLFEVFLLFLFLSSDSDSVSVSSICPIKVASFAAPPLPFPAISKQPQRAAFSTLQGITCIIP